MRNNESGQALLLLLLAMSTIVTVALSVVSRSVSDLSVTTVEEESLRAFSAAEAGVEESLVGNPTIGSTVNQVVSDAGSGAQTQYSANISGFPEVASAYPYPVPLSAGESATLWFMNHDNNDNLTCSGGGCFTGSQVRLCWGTSGTGGVTPAVDVSVIYESSGEIRMAKGVYDPSGRIPGSQGSSGSCQIAGQNFQYSTTLNFGSMGISGLGTAETLKMMKVRLLYNDRQQTLGFDGLGNSFPVQGRKIDSTGTAGDSTRRVEVYALYPEAPSIFDAAIWTPGDIVK